LAQAAVAQTQQARTTAKHQKKTWLTPSVRGIPVLAAGKMFLPTSVVLCSMLMRRVASVHWRVVNRPNVRSLGDESQDWYARTTTTDHSKYPFFATAELTHNNLGGLGPDSGEESFVITQVLGSMPVRMKFTVADGCTYNGKPEKNAFEGGVASISVLGAETLFLNVEVLDASDAPLHLSRFFLTVLDIDAGSVTGDGEEPDEMADIEEVTFVNISSYYLTSGANIKVSGQGTGNITFVANLTGNGGDNPTSPWNLTKLQMERSAMVEFRKTQRFAMSFSVKNKHASSGRQFLISGVSDLISASFGPCDQAEHLALGGASIVYNNLVGDPLDGDEQPRQIRYGGAGVVNGRDVDLWVELVRGTYNPVTKSKNGLYGNLGQISMGSNDSATFKFMFKESNTASPLTLSKFFFSFFDIDQGREGQESLTIDSGVGTFFTTPATTLKTVFNDDGTITFRSSKFGNVHNNPKVASEADPDEAVTFFFEEPISSFVITYESVASTAGRNFQFGGIAATACP